MLKHLQVAQANVVRNLKFTALKEKEKLSQEKTNLEFGIADLHKVGEKARLSLRG